MPRFFVLAVLILAAWGMVPARSALTPARYSLIVYGDSAAAVAVAIQAKCQGLAAVLVNNTTCLGGMTCSGLTASDINVKSTGGGFAQELYARIGRHYGKDYVDYFEPHVAQAAINALIQGEGLEFVMDDALDRGPEGVIKEGPQNPFLPHLERTYLCREISASHPSPSNALTSSCRPALLRPMPLMARFGWSLFLRNSISHCHGHWACTVRWSHRAGGALR